MQPVAVKPFTIGSILAVIAIFLGVMIILGVVPSSNVIIGAAIILLGLAFFI